MSRLFQRQPNLATSLAEIATGYELRAVHANHPGRKRVAFRIAARTRFVRDALLDLETAVAELRDSPVHGPEAVNAEKHYTLAIARFGDLPQ